MMNIYLHKNDIDIWNMHLTYYQQNKNSASNIYKIFTKNWWVRRLEAHEYFYFVSRKFNKNFYTSFDYLFTLVVNKFFIKRNAN